MLRNMSKRLLEGSRRERRRLHLFPFVGVIILLAPWPMLAQHVAMLVKDAEAAHGPRTDTYAGQKRRAALKRYLAGLSPESPDYAATERAIRDLDAKLGQSEAGAPMSLAEVPAGQSPLTATRPEAATDPGRSLCSAAAIPDHPGTTAAGSPARMVTPLGTGAAALQTNCYPEAPAEVLTQASAAAVLVVDNRRPNPAGPPGSFIIGGPPQPGNVTELSLQLVTITLLHAVAAQSRTDMGRQSLAKLRELKIRETEEETKRTDKQMGASARSEGTTSAAEKPNFQTLLGIALENGAIQKEVDGTTLTLSSTPYAIIAAARGDSATTYNAYEPYTRLGLSASFNISNEANPLASATRSQLSEASARFRFTKDRSIRSHDVQAVFDRDILPRFQQLDIVLTSTMVSLFQNISGNEALRREVEAELMARLKDYAAAEENAVAKGDAARTRDEMVAGIQQLVLCTLKEKVYDQVVAGRFTLSDADRQRIVVETIPNLAAAVALQQQAVSDFETRIEDIQGRGLGTFVYTFKNEATTSDYSTLKVLYEKNVFGSPKAKFVGNAGISLYHHPNRTMNQQSVRDFAAAFSLEGKAGRSPFILDTEGDESQITFSFTGRYQRMFENRGVAGKKADIGVAQFKMEIPFLTGASFPFSVTYANATELIKEDHVRANFGFSFDADKVLLLRNLGKFLKRTAQQPGP